MRRVRGPAMARRLNDCIAIPWRREGASGAGRPMRRARRSARARHARNGGDRRGAGADPALAIDDADELRSPRSSTSAASPTPSSASRASMRTGSSTSVTQAEPTASNSTIPRGRTSTCHMTTASTRSTPRQGRPRAAISSAVSDGIVSRSRSRISRQACPRRLRRRVHGCDRLYQRAGAGQSSVRLHAVLLRPYPVSQGGRAERHCRPRQQRDVLALVFRFRHRS